MRENRMYGSVRGSDIPSRVKILERSVELSTRLNAMPGFLKSSCYNFSYHRSNATTPDFLIHQHDCYELYKNL